MKLTDSHREWIFAAIRGAIIENPRLRFREDEMAEACTRVVAKVLESLTDFPEPMSFSKAIIGTDPKECPTCGSLWVISQRHLPRYLMPALQILMNRGGSMTAKELTAATGNRQVYTKFAWAAHWQLIEKTKGYAYHITEKGRAFLFGEIQVPEFLWMLKNKVVPTPEGEIQPRMVYIHELSPTDTDDHQEHVDRSAPANAN